MASIDTDYVRRKFGDGHWRTFDEMAAAAATDVPAAEAIRVCLSKGRGYAKKTREDQYRLGVRAMVCRVFGQLQRDGWTDSRARDATDEQEYRILTETERKPTTRDRWTKAGD